jgi:3-oxoadipate enol-lactonase
MPYLDIGRARLYYEVDGSPAAPAILLIHSGAATLRMWDPQVDALANHHFVARFDARGFGRTKSDGAPYSDRADAIALLDRLGIATATVVGCSRGGAVGVDLAIESPGRVTGLVTIGSSPSGFPQGELTQREQQMSEAIDAAEAAGEPEVANRLEVEIWNFGPTRDADSLDPNFVARAYELHAPNLIHVAEVNPSIPLDPPAYVRLAEIAIPTLIVVGDVDVSPILRAATYLSGGIPNAQLHHFSASAHHPSVEWPTEFEALLLSWLEHHNL